MNFNFDRQPEYSLNSSLVQEVIGLYGVKIKFVVVSRINQDPHIFKDFSHLKTDKDNVFEMMALPEQSDTFENQNYGFQSFGYLDFDNISLFVHVSDFKRHEIKLTDVTGNLVVLPSNKVMEVTDTQFLVPGINNYFTFDVEKTVYRLTCRPYEFKSTDEIDHEHLVNSPDVPRDEVLNNYDALDKYFNEIIKDTNERNYEVEVQPAKDEVQDTAEVDEMNIPKQVKVKKPMHVNDEKDVWGQYS